MASQPQTPITLSVSNLNAATNFYLSALKSLGYQYQNKVQDHTISANSPAVGIGPSNTTRVDLFLSESRSGERRRKPAHAHVVFPASSRSAVRDFYVAALNAGGRPVSPPDAKESSDGNFSATIQDLDGNKVEVCCLESIAQDPAPRGSERSRAVAPPANNPIPDRRDQVPDNYPTGGMRGNPAPRDGIPAAAPYPPSASRGRSPSPSPPKKPSSVRGSSSNSGENSSGKAVVGTLLGAAAGAAVVYAFTKETSDSKSKEAKFDSRREGRARLEDEARQRAYALAWREKAAKSRRQRADRDSGYYSERREASLDRPRYRTITYPQQGRRGSSLDGRESVASSRNAAKVVDDGPQPQRTLSHRSRPPPTHVSVSQPPSEPRRLSPVSGRRPRTVRRYIPVSPPSPPRNSGRRDENQNRERDVQDDDSDFDGLDDETVVPDDSISVASANAPSHKIERRPERRRSPPPSSRRRRPDVAVY